jgi:2-haloacid dehalogenase
MRPVLVFNLNGTLLDTAALDPLFGEFFGDASLRRRWFDEVVKLMLISAATTVYHHFDEIAEAAMDVLSKEYKPVSAEQERRFFDAFFKLPAYPDVKPGLEKLRDEGYDLAILTNGTLKTAGRQLINAGINKYFKAIHSADEVQHFKPAPEPYQMIAKRLDLSIGEMMLVAAHAWDIAGAAWAGCRTAFIRRPGQYLSQLSPEPNLIVNDLIELAAALETRLRAA